MNTLNPSNRTMLLAAALGATLVMGAGCSDRNSTSAADRVNRDASSVAATTDRATTKAAIAVDDAAITTKVKTAVLAEPGLKTLQIDVDTKDGVVTMSGMVDNPALKERAMQIAQGVSGVRSVVDNLAIKSTG